MPRPGDVLESRYVLVEVLGEGRSGRVFRARDRVSDRVVAVKIISDDRAARAEAAVACDAAHPRLASAIDAGRCPAGAFLVLELAAGNPASEAIAPGDVEALVALADQILEALAFLHANGLLHGDVKPANIRVDGGSARLVDLGLAGSATRGGTPAYAAPEALAGGARDATSDLYALGVTLFELATGRMPFGDPGDPRYATRALIGELEPAPDSLPAGLVGFLARLLAADPAARYPDANDARAALHDAVPFPASPADLAGVTPRLVARDDSLATLAEIAAAGRAGVARAVLRGPGGAGRSRLLVRASLDAAFDAGAIVVRPDGARLGLVRQILERAATFPGGTAAGRAANRLAGAARGELPLASALVDAAQALASASVEAPLWIGVDDLAETDEDDRAAVAFLARGELGRIAWVLVADAGGTAAVPALAVEVGRLGRPALAELVAAALPGLVEVDALADAADAAGGLAADVIRGLVELERAGALRLVSGRRRFVGEPTDAAAAFAPRPKAAATLAGADAEVIAALAALAVLTVPAPVALVARAAELDEDIAARALARAVAAGLALASGAAHRVASPEIAKTATDRFGAPAVARARSRTLEALADVEAAASLSSLELASARFAQAAGLGLTADAAALAVEAGRALAGSPRAAAAWFGRARAFGADASVIALEQGVAHARAGDLEAALTAFADAEAAGASADVVAGHAGAALARAGRYADALAAIAVAGDDVEARFFRAWSLLHIGRYDEALAAAAPLPIDDAHDRAWLARARGTVLWHRGRAAEGRDLLAAALADVEGTGDARLAAELAMSLATALRHTGDLGAAARQYARAMARFRDEGDVPMMARCLNNVAITSYQAGAWDEAKASWESFADLATRLDDKGERVLASNNLGMLYKDRGETARARVAFERAAELARAFSIPRYEAMARGNLVDAEIADGAIDAAAASLDFAERLARELGAADELAECARRKASLALARGDASAALALARAAADGAIALGADLEAGHALLVGVAAARALGDLAAANAVLDAAKRAFATSGTRLERARLDLAEAELLADGGETRPARVKAGAAARVFAELGAAIDLGRAQLLEHGVVGKGGDLALDLVSALAGATTAGEMLDRALERLLVVTGADRAYVVLLDGADGPRVAARRVRPGALEAAPRLSAGVAERVLASKKPLVLTDLGDTDLAARESVVTLGLRAALAAPLLRGDRPLGLLYLDSRTSPADLARWGLAPLEVACAVIAAPLDLLLASERERERTRALQQTADRLIESLTVVDAALELVAEESDPARRTALAREGRDRCAALLDGADRVLELLRDGACPDLAPEGVDVAALVHYAFDPETSHLEVAHAVPANLPRVRADALGLARVLAQVVDAAATATAGAAVRVTAELVDDAEAGAVLGWRPGGGSSRRVRLIVAASGPFSWADAEDPMLGPARRAVAAWGGRLVARAGGDAMALDLELSGEVVSEVAA